MGKMTVVVANFHFISYPNRVIKVWFPADVLAVGDCEKWLLFCIADNYPTRIQFNMNFL
jgi:hypothetical protein